MPERMSSLPDLDFHEIFRRGVPPYMCDQGASSPANASPYPMTRAQLEAVLEGDSWRLELLDRIDGVFADLEAFGASIPAFLIGGGFVRRLRDGTRPRDIDGLAFYTISNAAAGPAVKALAAAKLRAKHMGIDVRFCPMDADPIVMIRSIVFYSILFSKAGPRMGITNGLILYKRPSVRID